MKLKYDNQAFDIAAKLDSGTISATINDEALNIQASRLGAGEYILNIGGRNVKAYVAADKTNRYVAIAGELYSFKQVDDDEEDGGPGGSNADMEVVNPPMPGTIVKMLVAEGDKVNAGQGLLIMEAMKMETTLYASIDGTVQSIGAEPGQQVDDDTQLVVIKK